jgi:hypothetical protein
MTTPSQVAILTLLEGENALLELKAGDDAAKARRVLSLTHSSKPKTRVANAGTRPPKTLGPPSAGGSITSEVCLCSPAMLTSWKQPSGARPKFKTPNPEQKTTPYLTLKAESMSNRRLASKGVVNAEGQVI